MKPSKLTVLLRVLVLFATTLLFLALLPIRAQTDQLPSPTPTFSSVPLTLAVQGTVISGTAGVTVPAGNQITLQIVHPGKDGKPTESVRRNTTLGADGTFKFDTVVAASGDIALVSTTFQDVLQGSPPIQLANDQKSLNIPMTLYGVTTDASAITVLSVQHILDIKPGVLQVLATYNYKNTGDKLYVSQAKSDNGLPISVRIPLPVGAQAIAFNEPSVFTIGGDPNQPVVQDSKPLVPGQNHEIVFSYQLPFSPGVPIDQDYPYKTSSVQVLIPDDANVGITNVRVDATPVAADQLEKVANTAINPRRSYTQYTLKTPMKAGDRLVYFLGKDPTVQVVKTTPVSTSGSSNIGLVVLLFLFIIIVVIVVVVTIQTSRRGKRR
jgi:hypothetical protein